MYALRTLYHIPAGISTTILDTLSPDLLPDIFQASWHKKQIAEELSRPAFGTLCSFAFIFITRGKEPRTHEAVDN